MPKAEASRHSHGASELKERPALVRAIAAENRRVAARLRELREGLGLNQERAAERAGIHPKYLSRVESGTANPSLGVLVSLARAYDVPIVALFKRPGRPSR